MSMFQEFKEFAMRGNVMDMAVGIIIGGAFGKIVSSAVNDIIMPPIGLLLGGVDFTNLFVSLDGNSYPTLEAAKDAPILKYGMFIQTVVDFLIVAFAIFVMVKWINSLQTKKAEAPAPPPEPSTEEKLLTEIRDLLARR